MYRVIDMDPDNIDAGLIKDVAFNRRQFDNQRHVSPYDDADIFVGLEGIEVRLVQGIQEDDFKRTLSRAINATTGVDLDNPPEEGDWEEMLKGGLQTALDTQVIVFEVKGVSRTATHQIVRTRRAAFHQQSQRASFMGFEPNVRMPASIDRNKKAHDAFIKAAEASAEAYRVACAENISYQDARFALLEGTTTYILCEYPVQEFLNVYKYRACSMFQWEICHTVREMGRVLKDAHPWIAPYVKISCELTHGAKDIEQHRDNVLATLAENDDARAVGRLLGESIAHTCTFQGWEEVDEQCDLPWARETNRQFKSEKHSIKQRTCVQHQNLDSERKA